MRSLVLEPNSAGIEQRRVISAVAFSCLGWAFDLFDLFILLYIAPILAKVFFSSAQSMLSIAGVYAAFTASLLMRPVGGVLFGRYADKSGRKRAMIVTAVGVGVATALMGAIPTIETIGIIAPIVFIALRLVQGVFMGGMVASTHTIGTETISKRWRGLASGIISGGGSGIGKLMASLTFLIVASVFPGPAFDVWGWRVMFFSGLLSSILGLLVFIRLQESPMWESIKRTKPSGAEPAKGPLTELIRGYVGIVFVGILLTTTGGGLSYLTSGYLPTFLRLINHIG
jgi:MFS transporter, MHS family, proline/betaine transporter